MRTRQLLAYLLVLVAAIFANLFTIHNANSQSDARLKEQRAGCERTNNLRRQLNTETQAFVNNQRTINELIVKVAQSIPAESEVRSDLLESANTIQKFTNSYKPLAIINCKKAYTKGN